MLVKRLIDLSNLNAPSIEQLPGCDYYIVSPLGELRQDTIEEIFKLRKELAEHREFTSGATRDKDNGKIDYEGFLSPLVIEAFGNFMHYNRLMKDGSYRDSDNWQKGIPLEAYMKSGWRHFKDWWSYHRDAPAQENIVFAICGVIFNAQGFLHELLKDNPDLLEKCIKEMEEKRTK